MKAALGLRVDFFGVGIGANFAPPGAATQAYFVTLLAMAPAGGLPGLLVGARANRQVAYSVS